jgi:hypothetical protein
MDDLFDFQEIRVKQPTKLLAGRASYEILNGKDLLAAATEEDSRSVVDKITRLVPESRVLAIARPSGEHLLTLTFNGTQLPTEITDDDDNVIGKIRVQGTRRHYHLLDGDGTEIARAVGDLAVKRFSVTGTNRPPFAEVRKTFAGPIKEAFTSADNYTVRFVLSPTPLERMLTVLLPIVLDLARYE